MPRRILEKDIDEQILKAVIKIGASLGVKKTSSHKVATLCNVDHAVVIRHFGGTQGFWDAAAIYIDTKGMEKMRQLFVEGNTRDQIWDDMINYFLENSEETLYYNSYINTFGFDPTVSNKRSSEFLKYAQFFLGNNNSYTDNECLLMWDYVTTMAFYYAEKIIRGFLPNNKDTRGFIKRIVFFGLNQK